MKNIDLNREALTRIAVALGPLCDDVIFVGGAVVGLYIDDPAAEDIRPTKDVDLAFQIASVIELEELRYSLIQRGFKEDVDSGVICRFTYQDLLVDVMSTKSIGWAPSSQWFSTGFRSPVSIVIQEKKIRILPLAHFLATKLEAFFDRGIDDIYASTDLEDILYIFSHTSDVIDQIQNAPKNVKEYISQSIRIFLETEKIMNAIPAHLSYDFPDEQREKIIDHFQTLSSL